MKVVSNPEFQSKEWTATYIEVEATRIDTQPELFDDCWIEGPIHSDRTLTSSALAEAAVQELVDEVVSEMRQALNAQLPDAEKASLWLSLLPEERES